MSAGVSSPKKDAVTTTSRPSFYLVGKLNTSMSYSKLPKAKQVLNSFLGFKEKEVGSFNAFYIASKTTKELIKSWLHHFGPRFVLGKMFGKEFESTTNEKIKIVKRDIQISEMVVDLYKKWKSLEMESRRPDRSASDSFRDKEDKYKELLELPFNISKTNA